jgi:hypothetical protein
MMVVIVETEFEFCLNLSFRKATRVISKIYDRELADCGIKCTQFSILRATYMLKQTTNAELQERLVLDQTTLTLLNPPSRLHRSPLRLWLQYLNACGS